MQNTDEGREKENKDGKKMKVETTRRVKNSLTEHENIYKIYPI